VLGPGPPPGIFNKFYRFLPIFTFFDPSIEPEKLSPKSASTPYPPSEDPQKWKKWRKSENYRNYGFFYNL
jgi:hypothetical protein